jgi:hypothetical protein
MAKRMPLWLGTHRTQSLSNAFRALRATAPARRMARAHLLMLARTCQGRDERIRAPATQNYCNIFGNLWRETLSVSQSQAFNGAGQPVNPSGYELPVLAINQSLFNFGCQQHAKFAGVRPRPRTTQRRRSRYCNIAILQYCNVARGHTGKSGLCEKPASHSIR